MAKPRNMKIYETFWETKFGGGKDKSEFEGWLILNQPSRLWVIDKVKKFKIKQILDVACGVGLDPLEYKNQNIDIDYTGLDITPSFIKLLSEQYPKWKFINSRAQKMPFEDGEFECVTSRHLMEHTPNPEPVLKEMVRVSNKYVINGWFRLTNGPTKIVQKDRGGNTGIYLNDYNRDEMKKLIEKYNLKIIDIFTHNNNETWLMEKN